MTDSCRTGLPAVFQPAVAIRCALGYDPADLHQPHRSNMDIPGKAGALFAAVALCLFASGRLQAFVPPGHEKDLPNFDKRRDAGPGPQPLPPAKAAADEKLKGR